MTRQELRSSVSGSGVHRSVQYRKPGDRICIPLWTWRLRNPSCPAEPHVFLRQNSAARWASGRLACGGGPSAWRACEAARRGLTMEVTQGAATWTTGNGQYPASRLSAGRVRGKTITQYRVPWLRWAYPARSGARWPLGSSSWPQGDNHEVISTWGLARRIACPWIGWRSRRCTGAGARSPR